MVSLPGSSVEKFHFTVRDAVVAAQVNKAVGQRVSLHYEQKTGLPSSCFGETPFWVDQVSVVADIPLGPGVSVPQRAPVCPPGSALTALAAPAEAPANGTAPAVPVSPPAEAPASADQSAGKRSS